MYGLAIGNTLAGIINVVAIILSLNGINLPFFDTPRSAYITAFVLAIIMCSFGVRIAREVNKFFIPGMISGGILGSILLVVFILILFQAPIPIIGSYSNALILMAIIASIKWLISMLQVVWWSLN